MNTLRTSREAGMEARLLARGDRAFIDGRWRTVRQAWTASDGTVAVQTRWMSRRWSWTFDAHDYVSTKRRCYDSWRLYRLWQSTRHVFGLHAALPYCWWCGEVDSGWQLRRMRRAA